MNILMLVGSLRAESWTRQLVDAASALLPEDARSEVYAGLRDLPHYDQDLDGDDVPASVTALREAVVVASPEYNGTIPGVLKNAIDWASRPRGSSALEGLPVAVLSVSPSPRGAQWAREDLVKVLRVAGAQPLENAVGVATVHEVVVDGQITDPVVRQALTELVAALVDAEQERRAA